MRLSAPGGSPEGAGGTPVRAASELELHRSESADTADSASLQDEPLMDHEPGTSFSNITTSSAESSHVDDTRPADGMVAACLLFDSIPPTQSPLTS